MQQIEWPLWGQVQSVSETRVAELRLGVGVGGCFVRSPQAAGWCRRSEASGWYPLRCVERKSGSLTADPSCFTAPWSPCHLFQWMWI